MGVSRRPFSSLKVGFARIIHHRQAQGDITIGDGIKP
jgi:hypothetical protein